MNNKLIYLSLLAVILAATLTMTSGSYALTVESTTSTQPTAPVRAPDRPVTVANKQKTSGWAKLKQWGENINVSWNSEINEFPAALAGIPYNHQINLTELMSGPSKNNLLFTLDKHHPQWLQISADGQYLEGNSFKVTDTATQVEVGVSVRDAHTKKSGGRQVFKITIDHEGSTPRWSITSFPPIAIRQKNYADINLADYVTSKVKQDSFLFSLTPGKSNPNWVSVQENGLLHIATDKISPEDIDTIQVIYLTATSSRSGKVGAAEITIRVTTNDQLVAPSFQPDFTLPNATPGQQYFVNLAMAVNIDQLEDNDQLTFQLVSSSADWLQINENGFSLIAEEIPEKAANKYFGVTLRVSSKMSGRSNDFTGRIYVNPIPLPLQWQPIPAAVINRDYSLNLRQYINSNIKDDQFNFHIDTATLPHWLSIQHNQVLTGTPQEMKLLDHPQKVQVTAESLVTGLSSKTILTINVKPDPEFAPQWKDNFFKQPIVGEAYRSDDLTMALKNRYPHDNLSFEYLSGPDWLSFNNLCHCLVSQGNVPESAAGQSATIKLRVHSKVSGQSADYSQTIMGYTGVPQWTQTNLPDVQIAQGSNNIEIPLDNYMHDDVSGDVFTYQLDHSHSPPWISLSKKDKQNYLIIDPNAITANEVGTVQTVQILATSQNTHKNSTQLFTIEVKANQNLPRPAWGKTIPLSTFTVGVEHVIDLTQYIKGSLSNDRLTITLSPDSPSWLSIQGNRLTGTPPHDQVGGPYPVNFIVNSQASNIDTVISTQVNVQLLVVAGDNMESHQFYDNHQSIVIRGLQKNHKYRLHEVKGSHFDYGPFYSPHAIKTEEDWNGNPFYAVNSDQTVETGDDGIVSIVYYSLPTHPAPHFESIILR